MSPALMLALKYVKPGRKDSFISVVAGFSFVGIMLGVATLIVVMSVMNGFKSELMTRILGMNGHVGAYYIDPQSPQAKAYKHHQQLIQGLAGVKHAFALIEGQTMMLNEGRARGALVRGLEKKAFLMRPAFRTSLKQGHIDHFFGDTLFLGEKLALRLGVSLGDEVVLASPQITPTALGGLPKFRRFRIGGLFDFGMNDYDQTFVFMPLHAAQQFFDSPGTVSGFEIFVDHPEHVRTLTQSMRMTLGPLGLRVVDWQEANASFFSVVEVERNVMFIILALIILVAAFNVISSLVMLVKEKSRDIAILRSMGASQGMVCRLFLMVGMAIGTLGTMCGMGLGLVIAYHMEPIRRVMESLTGSSLFPAEFYFLSQLPSKVDLYEVIWVAGVALSLTLLSSLYPAVRAARLTPQKALRFSE
ncbi:lipoprotein-releasing ABC transporter permease subunit [Candidatus Hepatobacter penaei]|uniref:lipoprotein-releasing ABC transporter permease subunit n=1 Tax=Candidatus Hepatobacter penaei TaxID=1274402 RepID=UPI0004F3C290|nr:lipoprotein-releasing ABC transporter permease subunit [Candidatus Hepatobacter penaei]TGW14559.1 lipoprotein-releasing ABC transporter permease subunit [bacterium NHP-B]